MQRHKLIVANWKMHKTNSEVEEFILKIKERLRYTDHRETVICPSFVSIITAYDCAKHSKLAIGAQDMYFEDEGAYTGEISGRMLKDFCRYVIIGHSERREFLGETDKTINLKVKAAIRNGITPILCVGETLEQRKEGKTMETLISQIRADTAGISNKDIKQIVVAYEPLWAISKGDSKHEPATPKQAQKEHNFIRKLLNSTHDGAGDHIRIIYGGSVKSTNISEFMREPDIDGALVGNASLDIESFLRIANF
ncbi:MAG: triose-phosphate isomerase [Candidatus Woesearchaeota archaeon]